ncbi:MAG: fused MFS/spermidine synthase [Patescibacteria group bacterium]
MKYWPAMTYQNITAQTSLALSAASSLIYEVVATTVLLFYFTKSSYSVATILAVFLFGLGLGAAVMHRMLCKIRQRELLFGAFQLVVAAYAILVLANLAAITPHVSGWSVATASLAILLIPTAILGAAFPLATAMLTKKNGEVAGLAYASDLAGAIIGSLLAGFMFIPLWGNRAAVLCAVGFNLASSLVILPRRWKLLGLVAAIALGASVLLTTPFDNRISIFSTGSGVPAGYQFYGNSPYGLVTVKDSVLSIDNRVQCSFANTAANSEQITEFIMAKAAIEPLGDGAHRTLNIGLGCGGTLSAITGFQNIQADVVEINPAVVTANREFSNILDHPRVTLVIDDGLNYLRTTDIHYDSIIVDIDNPAVANSSDLYTVEAFAIMAGRLNERGTFALWDYGGYSDNNPHYLDIIYYSLHESFPYIYHQQSIFLASKQPLAGSPYQPTTDREVNTLDRNTLSKVFLDNVKIPI